MTIGSLAADVVAEAVLRAVRAAKGIPGYPAAADLIASQPLAGSGPRTQKRAADHARGQSAVSCSVRDSAVSCRLSLFCGIIE